MIFVLRASWVSLGVFAAMYCVLSLLVVSLWQAWRRLRPTYQSARPEFLFGLRVFPLLGAALFTFAFALPAFLLLEGGFDEDFGTFVFSSCWLLIFSAGLLRAWTAQANSTRVTAQWTVGADSLFAGNTRLVLHTKKSVPPLVLVGVSSPEIVISREAASLLSDDELRVAVGHELGHVQSKDNLKKIILHSIPFPGMTSLDDAWQEASELAADDAAVSSRREAIDLATALLKVAELVPVEDPPFFTTALVKTLAIVELRVRHLLSWDERDLDKTRMPWWYLLPTAVTIAYVPTHYLSVLLLTHRATEWFIH
jgi:hypothetical protein